MLRLSWLIDAADISFVVPVTNSITFLFTSLTSRILGESVNKCMCEEYYEFYFQLTLFIDSYIGIIFVLLGVSICVQSKL